MFLSNLQGAKAVSKCQVMNRRVGTDPKTIISLTMSLQTTVSHELRRREG